MSDLPDKFWKAKIAAFLHDPPEKAFLVPTDSHTSGTAKEISDKLFGTYSQIRESEPVKKADHWAATIDRDRLKKG